LHESLVFIRHSDQGPMTKPTSDNLRYVKLGPDNTKSSRKQALSQELGLSVEQQCYRTVVDEFHFHVRAKPSRLDRYPTSPNCFDKTMEQRLAN